MLFAARAERSAGKPIKSEIKHEIMIKNGKKDHEKAEMVLYLSEEKNMYHLAVQMVETEEKVEM